MRKNVGNTFFIGIILAGCFAGLVSCASPTKDKVSLTDCSKVYIVPAGSEISVIWNRRKTILRTDNDMVLLDIGAYYRLQKEAKDRLLQRS